MSQGLARLLNDPSALSFGARGQLTDPTLSRELHILFLKIDVLSNQTSHESCHDNNTSKQGGWPELKQPQVCPGKGKIRGCVRLGAVHGSVKLR
jgi:hypothetical protein